MCPRSRSGSSSVWLLLQLLCLLWQSDLAEESDKEDAEPDEEEFTSSNFERMKLEPEVYKRKDSDSIDQ